MDDLFTLFTSRLQAARIDAVVTGSVAAMIYGEPRLTHDVDLVVDLDGSQIDALLRRFPDEEFYCAPAEVLRVEALREQRGHFNIIHHDTGFKADVYIAGRDPLNRWALDGRRELVFGETTLNVAPPEYVIVRKLEYYREGRSSKHVTDIQAMLRHVGQQLDVAELRAKIIERGLLDEWSDVGSDLLANEPTA